jgi:hypothetical protein
MPGDSVLTHSFLRPALTMAGAFFGPATRGEDGFSFGGPCKGRDSFVDRDLKFCDIMEDIGGSRQIRIQMFVTEQ